MGFAFNTTIGAVLSHYTLYITQDLNLSKSLAGLCLGILHLGGIVGRPGWGIVSDFLFGGYRRLALIIIGFLLGFLNMFYAFYFTNFSTSLSLIYLSSFILGTTALGWNGLFFTTVAESVNKDLVGAATGLSLLFFRTGGVISPPIFGYIADIRNNYSLSWFVAGLVIFVFTLIFFLLTKDSDVHKKASK